MDAAELEVLNRQRLVARLLSATVHDTRNALQSISGLAELLTLTAGAGGPSGADKLRAIQRQAAGLGERLDQLLDLQGGRVAPIAPIDAGPVWTRALDLRRASWGRQRITATPAASPTLVVADGPRLLRVLLNLLLNAETSLVAVGGGQITLSTDTAHGRVTLDVSDTGPGVPGEEAATLFTTSTSRGRLATGLAASRALAVSMGGTLEWLGPDQPSAFRLRLPSGG